MNQQRTAQFGYWLKVVTLGVILGFGIQFAQAWTNPTAPAPTGNVAGPINVGTWTQVKNGSLGLVGDLAANMLQINGVATEGSACVSNGLLSRDADGKLLYCHLKIWKAASAGSGIDPAKLVILQKNSPNINGRSGPVTATTTVVCPAGKKFIIGTVVGPSSTCINCSNSNTETSYSWTCSNPSAFSICSLTVIAACA